MVNFKQRIEPYSGVIRFMVILIIAHFFWKFTVIGEESGSQVTFFGCDISAPFIWLSHHIASVVFHVIHWMGYEVDLIGDTIIRFANGNGSRIVWSCTGIKQAYIFTCIILFSQGPWVKKLWYIPVGLLVCYVVNLLRIGGLTLIIHNHRDLFYFFHEHLFKYLFYGVLFLMWVIWQEKLVPIKSINHSTD